MAAPGSKISNLTRKLLFKEQQHCQYRSPHTGKVCQSQWHIQTDHKHSKHAQGSNDYENLQLLCGPHNREKYRREVGTKFVNSR